MSISPRSLQRFPVLVAALLFAWAALSATPARAVKRRAFVTSVSGTGNLSSWAQAGGATGVAAGDAICRNLAAAAALPNAATYRAWLSTPTTDAYCHIEGLTGFKEACAGGPPQGAGPWYLANGISNFTAALAQLTNDPWEIYRPVFLDENSSALPADATRLYWTDTDADGTRAFTDSSCASWTSASGSLGGQVGDGLESAKFWTSSGQDSFCSTSHRLLCLEPGTSEESRLGWSPGSLVFLSSALGTGDLSTWPQAGGQTGLAAGDAICRNLATAAHLPAPESFVAWLSSTEGAGIDAADRVTSNGPFRRVDAYTFANSKADLIDGTTPNSLHVLEDGRYLIDAPFGVHTGTFSDGTFSPETCSNWTSTAGSGLAGQPSAARLTDWTEWSGLPCNTPLRLYCISNRTTLFWDGFELTGDTSRWSTTVP